MTRSLWGGGSSLSQVDCTKVMSHKIISTPCCIANRLLVINKAFKLTIPHQHACELCIPYYPQLMDFPWYNKAGHHFGEKIDIQNSTRIFCIKRCNGTTNSCSALYFLLPNTRSSAPVRQSHGRKRRYDDDDQIYFLSMPNKFQIDV